MSPSSGAEPTARLSTSPLRGRCVSSVLAPLSGSYPPPEGRLPMHYSPVCHFTTVLRRLLVRLACVRRAASVRSEPGSNSRKENLETSTQGPPLQYTSIQLSKNEWFLPNVQCYRNKGVLSRAPQPPFEHPPDALDTLKFLDPPTECRYLQHASQRKPISACLHQ